jgi:signal transduction histidine kinase
MIAWAVAALLALSVLRLRRRLELVARAEHELRGPLTAFGMAVEGGRFDALESELARVRVALADLTEARRGRRAGAIARRVDVRRLATSAAAIWGARLDWRAGRAELVADEGRVAQVLGNLLANAAEHGEAPALRVERAGEQLQLTVTNAERGRGLAIAADAARDAGGRLAIRRGDGEFAATLELAAP